MDLARAVSALRALREGVDPKTSVSEEAELQSAGAVIITPPEGRAGLVSAAAELEGFRAQVQEARRAVDSLWGPKSGWERAGSGTGPAASHLGEAQARLRLAVRELEARSLARAAVSGMVTSGVTGHLLTLTLPGRQLLEDLAAWGARFGPADFATGAARIAALRQVANTRVETARAIETALGRTELMRLRPATPAAIRASAILLSFSGAGAPVDEELGLRVAYFLHHVPGTGATAEDELAVAALLASYSLPTAETISTFESLRRELIRGPLGSSAETAQLSLLAAALTGETGAGPGNLLAKIASLVQSLSAVPPLALAALARAPYSAPDLVSRFKAGSEALRGLGYPVGGSELAAAAVLAASSAPTPAFLPRIAGLDPKLRSLFPSAATADAALAALPLTIAEASLLFDYCVGAISRASFFSDAPEVDYLALLLATGLSAGGYIDSISAPVAPPASQTQGLPGVVLASTPPPPSATGPLSGQGGPLLAAGLVGAGLLSVVFVNHSFWLLRSYAEYTRQHPLHANAVPVYG